jgi:hypothetical protein
MGQKIQAENNEEEDLLKEKENGEAKQTKWLHRGSLLFFFFFLW